MHCLTNKRGQLTLFVIIAIVLVVGILTYVFIRSFYSVEETKINFDEVFSLYKSCLERNTRDAIEIAGSQGGRVDQGEFFQGSDYAPFSSHLNFLGFAVPYWYYISGNGIARENVPTKGEIELEIANFVEKGMSECNLEQLFMKGYNVKTPTPNVKVQIMDNKVKVSSTGSVSATRQGASAQQNEFNIEINSKFGTFYQIAREIYQKQKAEAFLENYSMDVLRLNAPVDGVEISCSGKVWETRKIFSELKSAMAANVASLKMKGDYYSLNDDKNKYFVIDKRVSESVNFMYNPNWPTKIEVAGEGANEAVLVAEPIGNQEGMGIMGFCYTPYHFVYDISHPVLIQIYNEQELFQFPVAVVIDNNMPRVGIKSDVEFDNSDVDVCKYKTQDIKVNVYDNQARALAANISYICFNQKCTLGQTTSGIFTGNAPACVNGYLEASTSGYVNSKILFSTNDQSEAEIFLDKEYEVEINLSVGGKELDGNAIISFTSDKISRTISLPEVRKVKLAEGLYDISVFVYGNSSIVIPASTKRECSKVATGGVAGFFGLGGTKEQCYNIELPETKIDFALVGGGKSSSILTTRELEKGTIKLKVDSLSKPNSLEELAENYDKFETSLVEVDYG